jgi:glycosyltransferase involved in cell wall biosynthesis
LISVVCAVHNGERFISEAIDGVLAQAGVRLELILVDDGSTDGTPDVLAARAKDGRVTVVTQVNRGVAAARNAGISRARGEFVAFLDADDVWRPDKLKRQVDLLCSDPQLAIAFTGYAITDERLRPREVVLSSDLRRWMLLEDNGPLLSSTAMVRVSAVGPDLRFDEVLSTSADLEFAWRMSARGGAATVRAPLVLYRTHPMQMHLDMDAMERDVNAIYDLLFPLRDGRTEPERRRGQANMYTRLAIHDLRSGRLGAARRRVGLVLRLAPSRLLLLPFGALRRRAIRHALRFVTHR